MNIIEKAILSVAFFALVSTTVWYQINYQETEEMVRIENPNDNIDYYVTDFTTTNIDKNGVASHVLEGQKLTHYAKDDTAFIISPHVVEYKDDGIVQHTYAKIGWIGTAGESIKLSHDVKVFEHRTNIKEDIKSEPIVTQVLATDEMLIILKQNSENESEDNDLMQDSTL